ncbi:MAG TPA: hypothetical protein VGB26_10035 [Nitrospiria bacterium]|jgi:hypothetical protein
MPIILRKALAVWLVMVVAAILNGILREKVLLPLLGNQISLPLSGILLSILVFLITFLFIPFFGKLDGKTYIGIGILWVLLTLVFEFLFGHFVVGKTLKEIVQVFNLFEGNFFVLPLLTSAVSPWIAAKLRGFI